MTSAVIFPSFFSLYSIKLQSKMDRQQVLINRSKNIHAPKEGLPHGLWRANLEPSSIANDHAYRNIVPKRPVLKAGRKVCLWTFTACFDFSPVTE